MPVDRKDPYGAYRFRVELNGVTEGGFTEVSGLGVETEVETRKEGGVNDFEHKLPKGTKYSNLTLKHGIADENLWNWYKNVIYGKIERQDISVVLLDESREEVMRWNFQGAYPVKWDGPTLNSSTSTVATETLVIAHHGLEKPD